MIYISQIIQWAVNNDVVLDGDKIEVSLREGCVEIEYITDYRTQ